MQNETTVAKQNGRFVLAHNTITHTSLEYHGAPGICATYVFDTVIEHNEVSHLSYSGISLWAKGGAGKTATRGTTPSASIMYTATCAGRLLMHDGGSVYTLGPQGSLSRPRVPFTTTTFMTSADSTAASTLTEAAGSSTLGKT